MYISLVKRYNTEKIIMCVYFSEAASRLLMTNPFIHPEPGVRTTMRDRCVPRMKSPA